MSDEGAEEPRQGRLDTSRRVGPVLEAPYQLVLWVVPTVEKYPRDLKFTLGDRNISAALDVLDQLEGSKLVKQSSEGSTWIRG